MPARGKTAISTWRPALLVWRSSSTLIFMSPVFFSSTRAAALMGPFLEVATTTRLVLKSTSGTFSSSSHAFHNLSKSLFLVMKPLGGISFSTSSPSTSPVIRVLDGLMVWPWANAPPGARAVHRVRTVAAVKRYRGRMFYSFDLGFYGPNGRVGLTRAVLHCNAPAAATSGR